MHRPDLHQAQRRVGIRGAVLLTLGLAYIGIGASWVDPTPEVAAGQAALWRESIMPLWVWGVGWIAAGCSALVAGVVRRFDANWGYGPAGAWMLGWGAVEFWGWVSDEVNQGFRPSLIWAFVSALIYFVARLQESVHPDSPAPSEGP